MRFSKQIAASMPLLPLCWCWWAASGLAPPRTPALLVWHCHDENGSVSLIPLENKNQLHHSVILYTSTCTAASAPSVAYLGDGGQWVLSLELWYLTGFWSELSKLEQNLFDMGSATWILTFFLSNFGVKQRVFCCTLLLDPRRL